jgi:hypothetical protein
MAPKWCRQCGEWLPTKWEDTLCYGCRCDAMDTDIHPAIELTDDDLENIRKEREGK